MVPPWLHELAIAYLLFGAVCAIILISDIVRHPQPMAVMNLIWPLTALFGTGLVVMQYIAYGRPAAAGSNGRAHRETPFPAMVASGTLHCGAGCALGDIAAEWLIFSVPGIAVIFGYGWLFEDRMFAGWVLDFLFAFGIGIIFQYLVIAPMRHLSPGRGIAAAIQADALSLTAWQIGMYGFMAFAHFYLFADVLGVSLAVDTVQFWFMMQLAMACGFLTAYPVNWWLIRAGVKAEM
jgi:hypothetical protein